MRRKIRNLIWLIRSKFYKDIMVCYGTSLTEGSGWVKILQQKIPDWHIVNLAKGGMNSNWGIENLHWVLRFNPKIVLMEWAINDSFIESETPTSIKESENNLIEMIKKCRLAGAYVTVLGMNPPFNMFLSGRNPSKSRPDYEKYVRWHKMVCDIFGVDYIDITKDWIALSKDDFLRYCPDGLHPNELGSQKIIVPKILKELII